MTTQTEHFPEWERGAAAVLALLDAHVPADANEQDSIESTRALIRQHPGCFGRLAAPGHLTGSAWLVDCEGQRALLTHHLKLDRWFQLGGHADGEPDPGQVALNEAQEESGLSGLRLEPGLFDVDVHWIPERGDVAGHYHHDLRFVVRAGGDQAFKVSAESLDLAWVEITEIAQREDLDPSLRRMARKWLAKR